MINNYNIEIKNNEIILNIKLEFNYEISSFNIKNINNNLKNKIINIARRFNADKINIIINGIIISTLLFTPTNLNNSYKDNNILVSSNIVKESFKEIELDNIIPVIESIEENNIVSTIKNTNNVQKKNNNTTNIKETNTNEKVNNNIYVTIYRSNGEIISIELEEYLIGVVGSEMPASFNIEALKAQAIVARTYALKRIEENKILTDTVSTQAYKSNDELKSIWEDEYDKYYNKIKNAVNSTKGIVLKYNNKYIDAVYHSTSNGYTEDSVFVWNNDIAYLKSVESYDKDISVKEVTFSLKDLSNLLNTNIDNDSKFVLERNNSNRVTKVSINDIEIDGITFRNLLKLRSTNFEIEIKNNVVIITTYGYGHGVGMSQYGANEMAKKGYSYKDILNHYYTNIQISNIN